MYFVPFLPPEKLLKLSLCLTKHHAKNTYSGSGGISPRIPDLGTRWRRVATQKNLLKLPLSLTKHHTMRTYWGSGGISQRIPDLGTT
jgi:hypothetical protein